MYEERASDLPKLGNRTYIQGGTIFNGIADLCDEVLGPEWMEAGTITSFKLEREAVANGRLFLSDAPLASLRPNTTFVLRRPQSTLYGYFTDEGLPFRVEPYDEDSYYQAVHVEPDLHGEFLFAGGRPRSHFLRGLIGANKLLHQKATRFGTPLDRIQFLYLKGLETVCLQKVGEPYRVNIANATVADRGTEVWTINEITVRGESFTSQFRLCYRAQRRA